MKTCYTVPGLSTLDNNGIKDLMSINYSLEQLRVLHLDGSFFRIEITKDYVELNSIEEINLTNYLEAFENIQKFIHQQSKVYLFGVSNSNNISIYDIYLNSNFLSTKDFKVFENFGIPIAEPIIFGNITINQVLEEYKKYDKLYILPMVYIDDSRDFNQATITKIISGQRNKQAFVEPCETLSYPAVKTVVEEEVEELKSAEKPEVLKRTTKEERTNIFNETYKNVSNYFNAIKKNKNIDNFNNITDKQIIEWWEKNGKEVAYLYSIYTLPKTRELVYDYFDYTYSASYDDNCLMFDSYEVANVFFELWNCYHFDELKKHSIDFYDIISQECFYIIFENELDAFVGFFNKEYVEPLNLKGYKIV